MTILSPKKKGPSYIVYILLCADGTLYTGITTDVARRFAEHKSGKGSHYTAAKKVVKLLYQERRKNRSTAQKREAEIKSWPRAKKLAFLGKAEKKVFVKF